MIAFFFFSTTRKIEDVVKPERERDRQRGRETERDGEEGETCVRSVEFTNLFCLHKR